MKINVLVTHFVRLAIGCIFIVWRVRQVQANGGKIGTAEADAGHLVSVGKRLKTFTAHTATTLNDGTIILLLIIVIFFRR